VTDLELNDLLDAVACLPDPAHLLIESAHASTDAFCCPRRGGHLVREYGRIGVKFIYTWKESLEARERIEDGLLVGKKGRERIREFSFFRLERGERGEDLWKGCQCRRRWAMSGRCERWVCIHFKLSTRLGDLDIPPRPVPVTGTNNNDKQISMLYTIGSNLWRNSPSSTIYSPFP
jgi:hypothetical protein